MLMINTVLNKNLTNSHFSLFSAYAKSPVKASTLYMLRSYDIISVKRLNYFEYSVQTTFVLVTDACYVGLFKLVPIAC